jgi:hypothetical protein
MKKLLLLFLITLLPTQGFAVTFCPDGSMPTRAISMDGSYYEYKCVGKQNKPNTSVNYGPKRLFDSGTGWSFNATGRLSGTNGMSCAFLDYRNFVGTCNTGVNYGLCSLNVNADICGTDGTTYSFYNDFLRSSFGSYCSIRSTSTEIIFSC